MAMALRVSSLLLRLLAAASTLCAAIVTATSHDSTTVFGITLEAKFQHTPALDSVSACVPSTSLLSRLVIVPDVVLAMLLTRGCRCSSSSSSRSHGTAREERQLSCRMAAPICDQVPSFCDRVMAAMICGLVGVAAFLLIVLHGIHTALSPKFS